MHVLSLANIKGGVTKTTTAVNLAYGLARAGYRVLVLDMDPQCNTTYTLTQQLSEETEKTLYEVLIGGKSLESVVMQTKYENLFLAPGSIWLSSADLELAGRTNREKVLLRALRGLDGCDFVLIDTQPSLGLLTVNSLVASTGVIIPIALTIYALLGIKLLNMSLEQLRENMELSIPVLGVVACLADSTKNSKLRLEQVKEYFGEKVFQTVIPRNIKVEEANDESVPLYEYAPNSAGAKAYELLTREVTARAG